MGAHTRPLCRTTDASIREAPHRLNAALVGCTGGDRPRGCPCARLPDFLTAPQAPGRDQAQQGALDGDPEQRLDSVIFQKRSLQPQSLRMLAAEECQAQQSVSH